jgi:hypothetical protein
MPAIVERHGAAQVFEDLNVTKRLLLASDLAVNTVHRAAGNTMPPLLMLRKSDEGFEGFGWKSL